MIRKGQTALEYLLIVVVAIIVVVAVMYFMQSTTKDVGTRANESVGGILGELQAAGKVTSPAARPMLKSVRATGPIIRVPRGTVPRDGAVWTNPCFEVESIEPCPDDPSMDCVTLRGDATRYDGSDFTVYDSVQACLADHPGAQAVCAGDSDCGTGICIGGVCKPCGSSANLEYCSECYANGGIIKSGEIGCWCGTRNNYINAWFDSCPVWPVSCDDSNRPFCTGACPSGQTCAILGSGCRCTTPNCGAAPACSGTGCPLENKCGLDSATGSCTCVPEAPLACGESIYPMCTGTCPAGNECRAFVTGCSCLPIKTESSVCDSATPCFNVLAGSSPEKYCREYNGAWRWYTVAEAFAMCNSSSYELSINLYCEAYKQYACVHDGDDYVWRLCAPDSACETIDVNSQTLTCRNVSGNWLWSESDCGTDLCISGLCRSCEANGDLAYCSKCYENGGMIKAGEQACWCGTRSRYINPSFSECPSLSDPCNSSNKLYCMGLCPAGQVCAILGTSCGCTTPNCGAAPACSGTGCPPETRCAFDSAAGSCTCVPAEALVCDAAKLCSSTLPNTSPERYCRQVDGEWDWYTVAQTSSMCNSTNVAGAKIYCESNKEYVCVQEGGDYAWQLCAPESACDTVDVDGWTYTCRNVSGNWLWSESAGSCTGTYPMRVLSLSYLPPMANDATLVDTYRVGNFDPGTTIATARAKINLRSSILLQALKQGSAYRSYKDPSAIPSLQYSIYGSKEYLTMVPTWFQNSLDGLPPYRDLWYAEGVSSGDYMEVSTRNAVYINNMTLYFFMDDRPSKFHVEGSLTGKFAGEQVMLFSENGYAGYSLDPASLSIKYKTYQFDGQSIAYFRIIMDEDYAGQLNLKEVDPGVELTDPDGTFYAEAGTNIETYADHGKILTDLDICDYVDNHGVREVWIWMCGRDDPNDPQPGTRQKIDIAVVESFQAGPTASFGNGYMELPVCDHTYTVYDYNPGAAAGMALENHAHHLETIMWYIDAQFTDLFMGIHNTQPFKRCGWTHCPPNVMSYPNCGEYNWYSTNLELSDCEDWKPDGGTTKQVNCETWEDGFISPERGNDLPGSCPDDGGVAFKVWWMKNIPGLNNGLSYNGKQMKNFWDFVGDFDAAIARGKSMFE